MTVPDSLEPIDALLRDLRTSEAGLTDREAARRLLSHGPNLIAAERGRSAIVELVDQLRHPLALLLWVAAVLAWVSGTPVLSAAIVAVVVINALFAFVQERHSEHAVEALAAYLPQRARVVREGVLATIAAADLVPGDVLVIEEGDRVCADARLLHGTLDIDMSPLTGESQPVLRAADARDFGTSKLGSQILVFSGSTCVAGRAHAIVTATGMSTELGRIAALTAATPRELSPLEVQVRSVAKLIALVAVLAAAVFIPVGWLVAGLSLQDAITFALGLIVANVPEGLLPTITLALAFGVADLARQGALVKRLSAVETLGSADVICTDKTGTITLNRMVATRMWTGAGANEFDERVPADARLAAALRRCSTATLRPTESGDPTEISLLHAADALAGQGDSLGDSLGDSRGEAPGRRRLLHFDPGLRMMSSIDADPASAGLGAPRAAGPEDVLIVSAKGAPEAILPHCTSWRGPDGGDAEITPEARASIEAMVDQYAVAGLRVLAVADRRIPPWLVDADRQAIESELTFLGIVALRDPARPEVPAAVRACHEAGIRIVVITGDHALTARQIADSVGISTRSPLRSKELTEAQLDEVLAMPGDLVFARSSAETKVRIADALKDAGHVVAMTGDGVNDAPALRRADIGIAMGLRGTDVAREAATLVLTDDNFGTIVAAIESGRSVYDNIRKFIVYIFAHATPEIVPFLVFALSGGAVPLPLTVAGILCIDVGTEILPALALGREKPEPGVMSRPPRPRSEGIITRSMLVRSWGVLGGTSAVLVMVGFFAQWRSGTYEQATTMTFLGIVSCQIGTAFAARVEHSSLRQVGFLSNRLLLAGIAFEIVFAAFVVVTPGVSTALGMQLPSGICLALLTVFPVVVLGVDGLWREGRRRFAVPGDAN